jgi:hypothetical protein
MRGWVSPRAILCAVVKRKIPSPHRESNPITLIVQPVAQRYTDSTKIIICVKATFIYNPQIEKKTVSILLDINPGP